MPDAVVVGAGPNGLAAAIALARAGRSVRVLEAADTIGGGSRSAELTLPGFVHDICSAVHPHPLASPFLRELPLAEHGLELVQPELALAHPLDDGTAVAFDRSIDVTAASIGGADGDAYRKLMEPLVRDADKLLPAILGPLRPTRHPLALSRFGLLGLRSAEGLAKRFDGPRARALIAGNAAHSMLRLDASPTGAVALVLMLTGHAVGWPVARGGSQKVADALASIARSHGAEIVTGHRVERIEELDDAGVVLFDLTPRQIVAIAGHRLPDRYRNALERYRYGPGVFKLDWALDGPIPWTAPECRGAGTVHLGGTFEEIAASERGDGGQRPYVLLSQPTVCDPSRAPAGKHVGWAYCHVPGWLDRGHDRRHRGPGRALRARLPRADPRPRLDERRRDGGLQPQLRGRRHQRRPDGPAPAVHPPRGAAGPVHDARRAAVHLLVGDPAGRRRPRHVRLLRRQGGAQALGAKPGS